MGSVVAMAILLYIVRRLDFKQAMPTASPPPLPLGGAPGMPDPPSAMLEEPHHAVKVTGSSQHRPSGSMVRSRSEAIAAAL